MKRPVGNTASAFLVWGAEVTDVEISSKSDNFSTRIKSSLWRRTGGREFTARIVVCVLPSPF